MVILRLSLFRLKKNKKEAVAIAFLTMITTFMLALFAANYVRSNKAYDDSFAASGSPDTYVQIKDANYRDEYLDILKDDFHIQEVTETKGVMAAAKDVLRNGADSKSYTLYFVTEKTERKIEEFVKYTQLPEEEIGTLDHPIWLPVHFRISDGFELGDELTLLYAGNGYSFRIAGFYQSGLMSYTGNGFKCVISDNDYALMELVIRNSGYDGSYKCLWFNRTGEFDKNTYIDRCSEVTSENIKECSVITSVKEEKQYVMQFMDMFMYMLAVLSLVTLLAAVLMIMHRITNDIEDQMQKIGVLEALGHTAREISLTYVYEYAVCGGIGSVIGAVLALMMGPAMKAGIQGLIGCLVTVDAQAGMIFLTALLVTGLVILFALIKAAQVKRYPPVVALRKGIKTHHFRNNILPLDKTKGNIDLILAMKSFIKDFRSSFSTAACIIVAGVAIFFCINFLDFFKDGHKRMMETMCGYDLTQEVRLLSGVDPYAVRDEIAAMPEVRKALVSYTSKVLSVKGSDFGGNSVVFSDFGDAENIPVAKGRYPEHDNEIMITILRSIQDGVDIGDSIVLEGNGVENKYVVTGITSTLMMNGMTLYLTDEGYRRTCFNDRPNEIHAYLADGVTDEMFQKKLETMYGSSAKQAMNGDAASGSLEERIAMAADEKIAALLSQYGVSNVDYAIAVGDELITGNSRHFVVREVFTWAKLGETTIKPIANITKIASLAATVVLSIVVAVILGLIVSAAIKRQRKALGIMKGLDYSSRDLMTQMALKIMPVAIVSSAIAAVITYYGYSTFWLASFGVISTINIPLTIAESIVLAGSCYITTYLCAGKIKAVSVTELMTE